MESLMKGFPHLHKNSGLIRGKEVCVCVCVRACVRACLGSEVGKK